MKVLVVALFVFAAVAVSSTQALSCACWSPGASLSNALYTKKYAAKVRIDHLITPPTPAPTPAPTPSPNVNDPVPPQIYIPYTGWEEPNYYMARVKKIFKQPDTKLDKYGNENLVMEEDEWIVVQSGVCSSNPEVKTPYLIMSDGFYTMNVPGYGKAKVLSMPGYCDFNSKWDDVDKERRKQLRRYANLGETPCFETDCDWQNVAVAMPFILCADGTHAEGKMVCEYNKASNMCEKDLVMEACDAPDVLADPAPTLDKQDPDILVDPAPNSP